jgi:hypothetical protein
MFRTRHVARSKLAALGAVVVVLGGVACSALNSSSAAPSAPQASGASKAAPQPAPAPPVSPGAPAVGIASDAVQRSPAAGTAPAQANIAAFSVAEQSASQTLDRMIIRTAQLTVEVTTMEQALAEARAIAARSGGFVSASNTRVERVNDQDRTVADLTLQVRSDVADAALSDLRKLGKVTTETSGSQDVTEEYVDLDSNLRNLQASESAILKLMDKATRIEDVLSLQRELTNVRGQIERIQGRKRFLERRSDMATITLSLRLPPVDAARPLGTGAWDPVSVAQRGWQASLALLRGAAEVVIVVAAFSWWLVPFVAVGAYVWLHRRRTPTPTATTPAEA